MPWGRIGQVRQVLSGATKDFPYGEFLLGFFGMSTVHTTPSMGGNESARPALPGHPQPLKPGLGCIHESDPRWVEREIDLENECRKCRRRHHQNAPSTAGTLTTLRAGTT